MKKNRIAAGIAALALVLALAPSAYAADYPDANLGVDLGGGATVYTDFTPAATGKSCLDAIIAVRKDALDSGIEATNEYSKPTGKPLKTYLAEQGIAEADYLNPKWSKDLEKIALVRSVELFASGMFEHARPNGETWTEANPIAYGYDIKSGTETAYLENLAAGYQTCEASVAAWASEKTNWKEHNGGVTGHYTTMINPYVRSFGVGGSKDSYSVKDSAATYNGIWTLTASRTKTPADEGYLGLTTKHAFPMKVKAENVAAANLNVDKDTVIVGQTISPKVVSNDPNMDFAVRGTWSIENPALATVDSSGAIKGLAKGTTNMVLTTEDGTKITFPLTVRELKITAVTAPADVTTESGVAPVLPNNVNVTYEDNSTGTVTVTWDAVPQTKYDPLEAGDFTVNGTVAGWANPVTVKVHRNAATITGVDYTKTSTVESGTKPTLPEKATVTWSNHTPTTQETITWGAIPNDYKKREGGTFDVTGTVQGWDTSVRHTVTVNPATVTSIEKAAKVVTTETIAPQLPQTLKVTWSNTDISDEAVMWDPIQKSAYESAPATFSVNGTVAGQPTTVDVDVVDAVIESLIKPDPITIDAGKCPELPATVEAIWSNGLKTDQNVTWEPLEDSKCKVRQGGTVVVTGTVAGTDLTVDQEVQVNPATITDAALKDADKKVTTPSGTKPALPTHADVTWSNGEATEQAITWDAVGEQQYSAREGGSFTVKGTVADFNGTQTTLSVDVEVLPATVTGVKTPPAVETTVGQLPTLPKTVDVLYSNGDSVPTPVTWEKLAASDVAKAGQLTVNGEVEGVDDPVSLTVNMKEKAQDKTEVKKKAKGATRTVALAETGANTSALQLLAFMVTIGGAGVIALGRRKEDLS